MPQDKFIGLYHTEDNPVAVERGEMSGSSEKGGNHCGALMRRLELEPEEETRLIFLLGEGKREAGRAMRAKYSDHGRSTGRTAI